MKRIASSVLVSATIAPFLVMRYYLGDLATALISAALLVVISLVVFFNERPPHA